MSVLRPAPTTTASFLWLEGEGRFVGEASSTAGLGQVYDDAVDQGLTLISTVSGREIVFVVTHEEVDAEGDLRWWELRSLNVRLPYAMTLFND